MGKYCNPDVLDGAWGVISANATLMIVCSAQPTNRTEAVTTYALADVALAPGDFTLATGVPSGRKVTVSAKNGVTIDVSGTATHVAIVDGTRLLYVTICTSQPLVAPGTFNIPAWKATIYDPS